MNDLARIALAARVFTLAAVGSICAVRGTGVQGLGLILFVALLAQSLEITTELDRSWIAVVEGAVAAAAVIAAYPANDATYTYLAIPALVAGLMRGMRWAALVVAAEGVVLILLRLAWVGDPTDRFIGSGVTWLLTGLGLGYLGTVVRGSFAASNADASYRDALDLIKRLHALSGKLESGLDPVNIAEDLMSRASDQVVTRQAAVMLRRQDGGFSPLRYSLGARPGTFGDVDTLLSQAWTTHETVIHERLVALPLIADSQPVAVLLVETNAPAEQRDVRGLNGSLNQEAVRLSAALLFTDVREAATSAERQRIAREVHDGVAQDVASLGYLVDNLAESASDAEEAHRFATLRAEVTRVVKELRNSVFDLRNEVAAGQGLGQSIASFAQHVGSHTDLTIHVTLDEASVRLRPEVEAELLRIAQEGINNARRHSGADNLWVSVTVTPPDARIEVVDDGEGLKKGRNDSHGMRIMRERAERIGADLSVASPARDGQGTVLVVALGAAASTTGVVEQPRHQDA